MEIFFEQLILLLTPYNLFTLFWAVFLGVIVGALPGLTATMAISLMVGLTYDMSIQTAMVVLMGIYVGGIYGASKSAILIGIPGTSSASATVADGFALAKQGEGGPIIGLATISSAIGTIFGLICLAFLAPLLSKIALQFRTWEFFLLGILGVMICGNLAAKENINGWLAGFMGLLIGCIGMEGIYSYSRFSYNTIAFRGGISFVPAMIGLFGMTEVLDVMFTLEKQVSIEKVKGILPHYKDIIGNLRLSLQSGIIGVIIGIVPGAGEDIACWVAYDSAKRTSRHPEKFGKGAVEGVIAAETANNSCIGGALIPLLSLAIPGSPASAVLMSALWLHGIRPGPLLIKETPYFIPLIAMIMLLATFMFCFIGLVVTAPMNKVLMVPKSILMPCVMVLAVIGSYAINLRMFDVYSMFFFGILGYLMRKVDLPPAPMVLGLILSNMVDVNFRRALLISDSNIVQLFEHPLAIILSSLIVLMLLSQFNFFKKIKQLIKNL